MGSVKACLKAGVRIFRHPKALRHQRRRLAAAVAMRLAVVDLILLSGCEHKAPPPPPPPPKVSVVTVQSQAVPITTELPGRVAGYRTADVRPQVNGIILKRLFVEGSDVKAGQQLYQIDPAPYQASYDSTVAALASARALAERYKPLAEANAVSKQDYDNAIASHLQAQAAVETARINLIYTRVLSPITGRIGRSLITEGALVTANQATVLATVQQLDPVYVDVTQPSTTLLRLKREAAAGLLKQNATTLTRAPWSFPRSRWIRARARSRCARCCPIRSASSCPACSCAN
jgi:membrane fusion protein (multidrug efflux system)